MKYYYKLYMDAYVKDNQGEIRKKIEKDRWQLQIYLITLAKNSINHLEIFPSALLLQKAVSKDELFIVGMTSNYENALELVEKITQEVYDETGGVDIRNTILLKQKMYEEGNV